MDELDDLFVHLQWNVVSRAGAYWIEVEAENQDTGQWEPFRLFEEFAPDKLGPFQTDEQAWAGVDLLTAENVGEA